MDDVTDDMKVELVRRRYQRPDMPREEALAIANRADATPLRSKTHRAKRRED